MESVFESPFMFRNSIRDAIAQDPIFSKKYVEFMYEQYICLYDDIVKHWEKNKIKFPFKDPHEMSFDDFYSIWMDYTADRTNR